MATTIKTGSRTISVGDRVYNDGKILLDVSEGARTVFSDAPLVELLAALSKIPGVTAVYEKPSPRPSEILGELGLGAIFDVEFEGHTERYVKTGADRYKNASLTDPSFFASQFDNDNGGESIVTVLEQGTKP